MTEIRLLLHKTQTQTPIGTVSDGLVKAQSGRPIGSVSYEGDLFTHLAEHVGYVDLSSGKMFRGSRPQPNELLGTVGSDGEIYDKNRKQITVLAPDAAVPARQEEVYRAQRAEVAD